MIESTANLAVKICGLTDVAALEAAVTGGAGYVGFVFFPPSPRAVSPQAAALLVQNVPTSVTAVGLFVDPTNTELTTVLSLVPLRMIQLHGKESPERVASVRKATGLPIIKAFGLKTVADLDQIYLYIDIADMFLFDAAPPPGATLPGGNAMSFDWNLLAGRTFCRPWLLAGGLTAANLGKAVRCSGAHIVDVSSGVEDAPGRKSPMRIGEFLKAARKVPTNIIQERT